MERSERPEISVVMPVYNAVRHIEECVGSILDQTLSNFELIVIDDGSTDQTFEELSRLARNESRMCILRNDENSGIAMSLNRGIDIARAPLIARMDADDWALPRRLEIQKEFMDLWPMISVSGGAVELYEYPDRKWVPPLGNDAIRAKLLFESCLYHPTAIVRSCVFHDLNVRYDASQIPAEDYGLWSKLVSKHDLIFGNVPDVLLRYRVHPNSSRNNYRTRQRAAASSIRALLLDVLGLGHIAGAEQLHDALAYCERLSGPGDLKFADKWLSALVEACCVTGYCSREAIQSEVSERWRRAYRVTAEAPMSASLAFLMSPHAGSAGSALWCVLNTLGRRMKRSVKQAHE